MAPILDIQNLFKNYGSVEILKDINISIQPGDFLVLVGPSGCGKSTLLNCIAGLEPISGGSIHIGGNDMTHVSPKDRDIAMVFQSYALYPTMSVAKNITFGMKVRGVPQAEQDAKLAKVAAQLQIDHLLNRRPGQLSGGQRQRVAMGRALVRDPKLFLFDEPLSNLDAALRVNTRLEIAQLHNRLKSTMIYVTHDQVEAMTLVSRIVVLANKGISQVGTPLELYEKPQNEFVAQFIGSPAMNLFTGEVAGTGAQTSVKLDGGGFIASAYPTKYDDMGMKVRVGVRPEDFTPTDEPGTGFTGTVDVQENLGEVTLLFFHPAKAGDEPVIAKRPGIHLGMKGKTVNMTAKPEKVHLFANGRSLLYR